MKNKLSDYGVSGDDNSKKYAEPTSVEWLESMIGRSLTRMHDACLQTIQIILYLQLSKTQGLMKTRIVFQKNG
jgi:hypothetical protein